MATDYSSAVQGDETQFPYPAVGDAVHSARRRPRRANAPQRIVVDFTDLVGHVARTGVVSGIPRTVFEFANAAIALERDRNISVVVGFYDEDQSRYLELVRPSVAGDEDGLHNWLTENPVFRRGNPRVNVSRIKRKYHGRPLKRRWHLALARAKRWLADRQRKQRTDEIESPADLRELQFRRGDTLLMLGSSWNSMALIDHVAPLRKTGVIEILFLVYDLIPLLHLKHDDAASAVVFEPWLERIAQMGCNLAAISEETRSQLLAYASRKDIAAPQVCVAPLPHEFPKPRARTISPEVRALLSRNYALFVGPVAGRKNARRLLEAWAQVLRRAGPRAMPVLVIASSRGAEDIYDSHIKPIESHVRLLNRPNDYELSRLYSHASFTIFPSLCEGWGLPVGESLWHGTPCITSNCSSLPEVGGYLCDYVDPRSVDSIARAVQRFACDPAYRGRRAAEIRTARLRTWREFADQLLEMALANRADQAVVMAR